MDRNKYKITQRYLDTKTARRSGQLIKKVVFVVAHDTGNAGSTAKNNVDFYTRTQRDEKASAHVFVDDKEIVEIIPTLSRPEKAWHVQYQKPYDNAIYGCDANDAALGVELCYGPKINAQEAYKRYVWLLALWCDTYKLDPIKCIIDHKRLDPQRRSDPHNALSKMGKNFKQLLMDVQAELAEQPSSEAPVKIMVGDKTFDGFIVEGTSFAPARAFAESLGAVVGYDAVKGTVQITYAKVMKEFKPIIRGDRSFLAVRDMCNFLQAKARWVEATNTVIVSR